MKKLVCIIFIISLFFSVACAESEITFNSVPWLTDEIGAIQALIEAGLVKEGYSLSFSNDNPVYLIQNDLDFISPNYMMGAEDVTYVADLTGAARGKIAGCPVKSLLLTFAYNGTYQLISLKVDLVRAKYDDLLAKLTKVYGDGEKMTTEEGIDSIVWKGDKNSAVLLYTQSEGLDFQLVYGRLDAADILSQCLATPDPDDVSGL